MKLTITSKTHKADAKGSKAPHALYLSMESDSIRMTEMECTSSTTSKQSLLAITFSSAPDKLSWNQSGSKEAILSSNAGLFEKNFLVSRSSSNSTSSSITPIDQVGWLIGFPQVKKNKSQFLSFKNHVENDSFLLKDTFTVHDSDSAEVANFNSLIQERNESHPGRSVTRVMKTMYGVGARLPITTLSALAGDDRPTLKDCHALMLRCKAQLQAFRDATTDQVLSFPSRYDNSSPSFIFLFLPIYSCSNDMTPCRCIVDIAYASSFGPEIHCIL